MEIIKFLASNGAPVDLPDVVGLTALHHVSISNRVGEVLKLLLELGANPNIRDRYGTSCIFGAMQNGQADALKCCLEYGADLNIHDADGVSALELVKVSTPAVGAVVGRRLRKLEQNGLSNCAECGKGGCKHLCARCRIVWYCDSQCQSESLF